MTTLRAYLLLVAAVCAGALLSGCALGHSMKTVETVPKGEVRNTVGLAIWFPKESSFYSDSGSIAELGENRTPVFGPLYHHRIGLTDRIEAGFSVDLIWPGVGGKIRLTEWAAVDANLKLKLPVWEDNPKTGPMFDASLILGTTRHAYGMKVLSHGLMPGTVSYDEPEATLFYGFRHNFMMPELIYMARARALGFGLGFVF